MANESVTIDSGSPQRVALDLAVRIWHGEHPNKAHTRKEFLDLFAECLDATQGRRDVQSYDAGKLS